MSNINPLTICARIGNSMHFMDPATLQSCDITGAVYWRSPFDSLATVADLVEFTVLDIEPSGPVRGKWVLADAQVAMSGAFRSSGNHDDMDYDDGVLDQIYHTRTHLGAILQPGDTVMGYHLTRANFNSDDFAALPSSRIPDVVLVKKSYPNRRKKARARNWRLKSIAKEAEEDEAGGRGVVGRMGGRDQKKVDEDYELFLRELEEDSEMRAAVNLYKNQGGTSNAGAGSGLAGGKTRKKVRVGGAGTDMDMDEDEPSPADAAEMQSVDEQEEAEADFPEIKLDELLEDFDEMALNDAEDDS